MSFFEQAKNFIYSLNPYILSNLIMIGCLLASGGLYIYRKRESEAKLREHNKLYNSETTNF